MMMDEQRSRREGRLKRWWMDGIKYDLRTNGPSGKEAHDRAAWK